MSAIVAKILLPATLALIMFAIGTQLRAENFRRQGKNIKPLVLGLALQLFMLPMLALALINVIPLPATAAAGLFLLALCPGGATSSFFTWMLRGDLAMSLILTTVTSLLSPFWISFGFALYISELTTIDAGSMNSALAANVASLQDTAANQLLVIFLAIIKPLLLVSVVPVLAGSALAAIIPEKTKRYQAALKTVCLWAMIIVVSVLIATNYHAILTAGSNAILAVLTLCSISMLLTHALARQGLKLAESADTNALQAAVAQRHTLVIEVGIQNAGTAILVSLTVLENAALATLPLIYGVLMNLPAFIFVALIRLHIGKATLHTPSS